jgi:hypothetical protein
MASRVTASSAASFASPSKVLRRIATVSSSVSPAAFPPAVCAAWQ